MLKKVGPAFVGAPARGRPRLPWLALAMAAALLAAGCAGGGTLVREGRMHVVASAHPAASRAGLEIFHQGGNAFDAAVAVAATLAVVEPYSSGLGGGGFWLLHLAEDGRQVFLDGRERAPLAATRDMYLDAAGNAVPGASLDGPLAAGIPGVPAALVHLAREYGRLPLAQSLAPAIRAAREGFAVTPRYRRMAAFRRDALRASPAAARIFLLDGEVPPEGHLIRQPELAAVLERLGREGRAGFYRGETARRLVAGVRAAGGIWSQRDLEDYRVVEREPVTFRYRGARIVTAPPPSSGGVALATMLNILAGYELDGLAPAARIHLITEAMRRAYRDRAVYLGDPDFVQVPVALLTSPAYAAGLRAGIHPARATPSALLPGVAEAAPGTHTTHYSIIDAEGNRVAATLSINWPFGSGFVAPGTGILLNDEMDDFAARPGAPNAYGLVGAEANAIAPGKRMLSSMSPTFVETPDRIAVLGTPGGSRIITMVLHAILGVVAGDSAADIVARPRWHHQYLPDEIQYERGAFDGATLARLAAMGHRLREVAPYGNMQVVIAERDSGIVTGAADPRGEGLVATSVLRLRLGYF